MIVVGAGIIGLACAWRLAQQRVSVTIFDAGKAGCEASWAGAGMLAPGGEFEAPTPLALAALDSLRQYPEFVEELESESGCSIDFRRSGAIEVAFTEPEFDELNRRGMQQAEFGIRSEACSHQGRPARFYPDDAVVDPRDVTRALRRACMVRGVQFHENEAVLGISADGTSIQTGVSRYESDRILIAAGAWSSDLYPGLRQTMPVRGHLISWKLRPGLLKPVLRHGHTYILQRRSGIVIAGSTMEQVGFDRTVDESAVADIQLRAAGLMPELASERPDERWVGFRPGIEGEGPAIGRVPGTCVWTAFGHFRNGILLAPETARQISASVN